MPGEHGGGPPVRIPEQLRTVVGPLMACNLPAWGDCDQPFLLPADCVIGCCSVLLRSIRCDRFACIAAGYAAQIVA